MNGQPKFPMAKQVSHGSADSVLNTEARKGAPDAPLSRNPQLFRAAARGNRRGALHPGPDRRCPGRA